jgi:hypothetical protein
LFLFFFFISKFIHEIRLKIFDRLVKSLKFNVNKIFGRTQGSDMIIIGKLYYSKIRLDLINTMYALYAKFHYILSGFF